MGRKTVSLPMRTGWLAVGGLLIAAALWLRADDSESDLPATVSGSAAQRAPELIGRPTNDPEPAATPSTTGVATAARDPLAPVVVGDPIELGNCAVHISLVDAATGDPVASTVQLWRLDAPENVNYERGDQMQQRVNVGKAGYLFQRLAPGTYRVHAEHQADRPEDPPAFEVAGVAGRREIAVPMPRKRPAILEVYDQHGRQLGRGRTTGGDIRTSNTSTSPRWKVHRARKGNDESIGLGGGAGGALGGRRRPHVVHATHNGFYLGVVTEGSRVGSRWRSHRFHFDHRSSVTVDARFHATRFQSSDRDHIYRAVSLPMLWFHDAVRLPDGTRAVDHHAYFWTTCQAKLAKPYEVFDARNHVVKVEVSLKGYEKLSIEHVPGRGVPDFTMTPVKAQ